MNAAREPLIDRQQTLGELLHSLANDRLPVRALRALPLLLPLAAFLMARGWLRTGGLLALVGVFGVWALCEHAIEHRPLLDPDTGTPMPPSRLAVIVRAVAAFVAVLLGGALVVDLVVRVLGLGMSCPGCAG